MDEQTRLIVLFIAIFLGIVATVAEYYWRKDISLRLVTLWAANCVFYSQIDRLAMSDPMNTGFNIIATCVWLACLVTWGKEIKPFKKK